MSGRSTNSGLSGHSPRSSAAAASTSTVAAHGADEPVGAPQHLTGDDTDVILKGRPWYEQRLSKGKKTGKWRVIWIVQLPGNQKPVKRNESGFARKALAEDWAKRLHFARSGTDGWSFDSDGHPVQPVAVADVQPTILEDIQHFVLRVGAVSWESDDHFDKCRSVLVRAIAHLLIDATLTGRLLEAWEGQNHNQKERPEPTDDLEWAGRYLRDACLVRSHVDIEDLDPGLARGREWLLQHCRRRDEVEEDGALDALYRYLHFLPDGSSRAAGTSRSYWGLIRRFCSWQVDRGAFTRDPSKGYSQMKRDLDADKVDPKRVPARATIWRIALQVALHAGRVVEGMLVLVLAHCALRIGEGCELRRKDVELRPAGDGGAWVTVRRQWDAPSEGASAEQASKPTKGHRTEAAGRRRVYLEVRVAWILRLYMRWFVADEPNSPLFPGKRAHRIEPDTFRRDQWNPVIATMFKSGDPLHDLDLHDLRRAGMTMWLRNQVPLNTIARWGGWKSRKVMLDVYAAFLPDDDELAIWNIENRRTGGRFVSRRQEFNDDADKALVQATWDFRCLLLREERLRSAAD